MSQPEPIEKLLTEEDLAVMELDEPRSPELEILPASLGTGILYRRWQRGDISVFEGKYAFVVADVEDDGTPTGNPVWAKEFASWDEVERRRKLVRPTPRA